MIKAVLFDIDTLIPQKSKLLLNRAFNSLAEVFFSDLWGIKNISKAIVDGIQAMCAPSHFDRTNAQVMLETLQQHLQLDEASIRTGFTAFYEQAYPQLKPDIHPVTVDIAKLLNVLRNEHFATVIVTNPIHPEAGVLQWLKWLELPNNDDMFITHADNMHFVKSVPAYYAEIIARIGIEPDEAVIVGYGAEYDNQIAPIIGVHTYCITDASDDIPHRGTLDDFYRAVQDNSEFEQRQPFALHPQMIEPQYIGNIGALFGLVDTIKPAYWHQHPDPQEWSPVQIICHLVESEKLVQRPRLKRILHEDNPFITSPKAPPKPDQFACHGDGRKYAQEFMAERLKTLDWLRTLTPKDWQRPARHSIFGKTSLLEMAHFTAQHDRLHIEQLCQTLGKCE